MFIPFIYSILLVMPIFSHEVNDPQSICVKFQSELSELPSFTELNEPVSEIKNLLHQNLLSMHSLLPIVRNDTLRLDADFEEDQQSDVVMNHLVEYQMKSFSLAQMSKTHQLLIEKMRRLRVLQYITKFCQQSGD